MGILEKALALLEPDEKVQELAKVINDITSIFDKKLNKNYLNLVLEKKSIKFCKIFETPQI